MDVCSHHLSRGFRLSYSDSTLEAVGPSSAADGLSDLKHDRSVLTGVHLTAGVKDEVTCAEQ